jgi:hypothetical protein
MVCRTVFPDFGFFSVSLRRFRGLLRPRMNDKLAEILATKEAEVAALLPRAGKLRAAALQRNEPGGFRAALDRGPGRIGVIA